MTTAEHPEAVGEWAARLRAHPRFHESRARPSPRRPVDPLRDAPRRILAGLALLVLCPASALAGLAALYGLIVLVGRMEPEGFFLFVPASAFTAVTALGGRFAWSSLARRRTWASKYGVVRRGARVVLVHRLGRGRGRVELELLDGTRAVHTARLGLARGLRGAELGIAHFARGTLIEFDVLLHDETSLVTSSPRDPLTPRWIEMA